MTAKEFVARLKALTPTMMQLRQRGYPEKVASIVCRCYEFTKRESAVAEGELDPLPELLARWDMSQVQIGMFRFNGTVTAYPKGLQIGVFEESDPVVIAPNGEIAMYEHATNCHLLGPLAENGSRFLNALVVVLEFRADQYSGKIDDDDEIAARAAAEHAAIEAGGIRFLGFYEMLLAI